MANGELIDAREAMNLLGINEQELQTLVARGDLRAFRSAGTMKFRREDVSGISTDKGTEPTIIIPPQQGRKPGQSGILSSVPGPTSSGIAQVRSPGSGIRAGASGISGTPRASGILSSVPPSSSGIGHRTDATGEIVFDDIELMPTEDGMNTQQATVVGSAIQTSLTDVNTVVDQTSVGMTSEATVVETGPAPAVGGRFGEDERTKSTGPAAPVIATGSGKRPGVAQQPQARSRVASGVAAGPNISRVRQPTVTQGRRTATVYEQKSAHPIMTTILVLNTCLMLFIASICGVIVFKGHIDNQSLSPHAPEEAHTLNRVIPPYLIDLDIYGAYYEGWPGVNLPLPGRPMDPRDPSEPPFPKTETN